MKEHMQAIKDLKRGEWYMYHHAKESWEQWGVMLLQAPNHKEFKQIHACIYDYASRGHITCVQKRRGDGFKYYVVGLGGFR
jgi:hypothetical protein